MPYIKEADRNRLGLFIIHPQSAGELNYVITMLVREYFRRRGDYQAINDVVGALEGAKLEFYRRVACPYEDSKIRQNGDVY